MNERKNERMHLTDGIYGKVGAQQVNRKQHKPQLYTSLTFSLNTSLEGFEQPILVTEPYRDFA